MATEVIILTMLSVSLFALLLERYVAWVGYLSAVCLVILIAMMLSTLGVIPREHALYDIFTGPTVPVGIVLLLLGLRLDTIGKIPKQIIFLFALGACGSVIGGIIAGKIGSLSLGTNAWKLAAQLTASYIGGGENAVAMKKLFDIPNELFITTFAVDNVLTSLWLMFCIGIARTGEKSSAVFDGADVLATDREHMGLFEILVNVLLALAIVKASEIVFRFVGFPHQVLIYSLFAILVAQLRFLRNVLKPSYILGTLVFLPFFFSIGAMSDFRQILNLPGGVILMPFIIVGVHGIVLFSFALIGKRNRRETAVTSQSLIGGPATAVAVAQSINWRTGVSLSVVLGVIGYAVGNFFGWLVFHAQGVF